MTITKEYAESRAAVITLPRQAFIDGKCSDASDGGTFQTLNPATGNTLCAVAHCTSADVDRAVAADTEYGLHATVFTRDIDRALYLARRLPCATVSVNGFSEGDIKTPFGGYSQSGSRSRDNGTEAMDQYLQTKTIWISQGSGV